jgi:hypothetical protein
MMPDRVLPLDAMFCTEVIHLSTHVLTTIANLNKQCTGGMGIEVTAGG